MARWLDWLGLGKDTAAEIGLAQAIERAVYLVEPRLKQAGGYPRRYRVAIGHALRHARLLAGRIPGPVALNRQSYLDDPFIHALFGSPEDITRSLCRSRALHDFESRADVGGEAYFALMGMRRDQRQAFGIEAEGAILRRDVAQQTVAFTDHTLSCVAADEAGAREQVAWSIFDSLVGRVASYVETLRQDKQAQERRRDELTASLRGAAGEVRAHLEADLASALIGLRAATERLGFARIAEYFDAQLRAPEALVTLEPRQVRLDGMGIVRHEHSPIASRNLAFADLMGLDRRHWTVVMVRCPREELPPLSARLQSAERWLTS